MTLKWPRQSRQSGPRPVVCRGPLGQGPRQRRGSTVAACEAGPPGVPLRQEMESMARVKATRWQGYLLGPHDTHIVMNAVVPSGCHRLDPGPLAHLGLRLHEHDLHNLGATVSLSETVQKWREYRHQCQRFLREAPSPATDLFCNRTFDDYACWPDGPPGSFVNVSCPWYLPWANSGDALHGERHLHCTRNYIHLNLFASFILRALSVFVKDAALKWMYSTAAQQHEWDGLLSYQVRGVPLLFVIPWGIVKYLYEDEGCWTRNSNMNYWLIIRLPILFAIGVNFLIFVRVICIVVSKLKANLMCKTDIKCRLAKSTLTLIPLLGTHEVIFAFVMDEHARGTLRFIKLLTELSFTSFQGLMVAILYCFVNNEVQLEFRKRWERWRLERLHMQRDSSMKPLQCPTSSLSSGATVGSSVYSATCQASCS
ncbi:glucagon-like peptide 1 receptor [Myotis lucifugus]|uniref:glucagon-like peptide 1 receptor n=1 Tax=Myotis lucifugus TaxID=59463 RepID=UPI0003C4D29B|nr:glucagon-like peptide 1 receptor [Myotis lucifugus]